MNRYVRIPGLYFCILMVQCMYSCSSSEKKLEIEIKGYVSGINALIINQINQQYIDNDTLISETKIVSTSFDTLNLKDILVIGPRLFLYYTDKECSLCLHKQFEILQGISDSLNASNIVVLANVKSLREMAITFREYRLGFDIYQILNYQNISHWTNQIGVPFYFISDSTGIMRNTHIPYKELVELTQQYLTTVIARKLI